MSNTKLNTMEKSEREIELEKKAIKDLGAFLELDKYKEAKDMLLFAWVQGYLKGSVDKSAEFLDKYNLTRIK